MNKLVDYMNCDDLMLIIAKLVNLGYDKQYAMECLFNGKARSLLRMDLQVKEIYEKARQRYEFKLTLTI